MSAPVDTSLAARVARAPISAYDPYVAYLAALLSTWSYSRRKTLRRVLERPSIAGSHRVHVQSFHVDNPALPVDSDAYLVTFHPADDGDTGRVCALVFRGTEPTNSVDFLTDALCEQHPWLDGDDQRVHRGFYLSFDVLWPEVRAALLELGESDRLIVTGHSLGGAIAVLAARAIEDDRTHGTHDDRPVAGQTAGFPFTRCGVYTFGQPMVGNKAFVGASAAIRVYRHVFGRDLVPALPPEDPTVEYAHVGDRYASVRQAGTAEGPPSWRWEPSGDEDDRATIGDFAPAFLTLLTARLPTLGQQHPLDTLWALFRPLLAGRFGEERLGRALIAGIDVACEFPPEATEPERERESGLRARFAARVIGRLERTLFRRRRADAPSPVARFSIEDHIPTYYVEVCRSSRPPDPG